MKKSGFPQLANELFQAETEEQKMNALITLFDETSGSDKLNQEELAVVLKAANNVTREGKGWFSSFLGSIGEARFNLSGEKILFDYLTKVNDGKEHETAKDEAVAEEQIRSNPDRTKYSIGDLVETPMGPMYVWDFFDDGEPDVRPEKPKQ